MSELPWGAGHCPVRPFLFSRLVNRTAKSVALACVALLLTGPARADFAGGLAAYDSGDYYGAYLAWLPLARAGDGDAQAANADFYLS